MSEKYCKGITQTKKPCTFKPLEDDDYCKLHQSYKKLYSIWEFSNKHRLLQLDTNYTIDDVDEVNHKNQLEFGKGKTKALKSFLTEKSFPDTEKFNQWKTQNKTSNSLEKGLLVYLPLDNKNLSGKNTQS